MVYHLDTGTCISFVLLNLLIYFINIDIANTFIVTLQICPFISLSDIVNINGPALILKIISQCDVSDTEDY